MNDPHNTSGFNSANAGAPPAARLKASSKTASSVLLLCALAWTVPMLGAEEPSKEATPATVEVNKAAAGHLPAEDQADFRDAERGFIATLPESALKASGAEKFAFLDRTEAPETVNPALWRQARVNLKNGLFKVTDRIYQVRGLDISNMTIIEGDTGLIIVDPLTYTETARAGLDLYYENRPKKPVVAVIYSHSHADHFGGVKGVISEDDVAAGKVKVIAPLGFMEALTKENVLVGNAMSRRGQFQFGGLLPKGEKGLVDVGLGKVLSHGSITLIAPTDTIAKRVESRRIDGVDIVFINTPDTEAPAEMIMYYPQFRALNMAELVTHNLHNLLPLRGTQVRNANDWAKDINFALAEYGAQTDVLLAQHHWPTWGQDRVGKLLRKQRDLYKYINDQTIRLINQGYTPSEIAETLKLPASLSGGWSQRQFYGTVSHDSKAVYQRMLGWYDGNPANLNPLPPVQTGRKFVEYMDGAEAVLARARKDFAKGEYRWVAQVTNQLVFAEPGNNAARELEADAFEQLGYQSESATWRNAYLEAALELRGKTPTAKEGGTVSPDIVQAMPLDDFFDYLGVRLNGPRAEGKNLVFNWHFTDTKQDYLLNLENSALTYLAGHSAEHFDASLTLTRATLNAINLRQTTFREAVRDRRIQIEGDPIKLVEFMSLLDTFEPNFAIVTPKPGGTEP
jgi:alkyl sulfatase BDS1-like metallo-beta-lactamase superfamily hydrolase